MFGLRRLVLPKAAVAEVRGNRAAKLQQIVGAGYDDYTREVGRVFDLSNGLAIAVDHLLVGFFKERESAILRQETVSIAIPHEIRRQHEFAESLKTSTDKAADGLRHRE